MQPAALLKVAVVTFYAIVDGLVGGLVFGWLYNRLARPVA